MDKETMAGRLREMIETSDAMSGEYVILCREDAVEILRLLTGEGETLPPRILADGKRLFFCADCAKSFPAEGREDPECFGKWQYHTWYAACPRCGRQVSQNDRYWR